jgi:hypothetical protein
VFGQRGALLTATAQLHCQADIFVPAAFERIKLIFSFLEI